MTVKATDASFEEEVLKSDTPVLVDFWAEWCTPCKMIAPILDEIASEHPDAIKIANDTDYGLSAGVWGSEDRALEVARRLDAGMVWVNNWHVIHPAYPFGGFKESGLGREGGPHSIDEYVEQKFISLDRSGGIENKAFAIVIDPAGN